MRFAGQKQHIKTKIAARKGATIRKAARDKSRAALSINRQGHLFTNKKRPMKKVFRLIREFLTGEKADKKELEKWRDECAQKDRAFEAWEKENPIPEPQRPRRPIHTRPSN